MNVVTVPEATAGLTIKANQREATLDRAIVDDQELHKEPLTLKLLLQTDGPVQLSQMTRMTYLPSRASATARLPAVVDLPSPRVALVTTIEWTSRSSFGLAGSVVAQLAPENSR